MTAKRIARTFLSLALALLVILFNFIEPAWAVSRRRPFSIFRHFPRRGPPRGGVISETRFLMGTVVEIKIAARDCGVKAARDAAKKAFSEMERVEGVFSVYKENSEISRINRLKVNEKLKISDEVFWLIKKSIDYNKKTKGAFDVTVKPLVDLWNRAKTTGSVPAAEEIRLSLNKVGPGHLELDDAAKAVSFKKDGMGIDLGGVAKGYAVDMAVKTLKDSGISSAVVNAGGDMYCLGEKAPGTPWKIGMRHPRDRAELFSELRIKDKAVVTSGDYERFFTVGARRYSHIIDPRDGYPIGDDTMSATVVADDSAAADCLATALCVLGKEGLGLIKSMNGVDAVVMTLENGALKAFATEGMTKRYGVNKKTLS